MNNSYLPTFICKCKKPCVFIETTGVSGEYSVLVRCIECKMYSHAMSFSWDMIIQIMVRQWESSGGTIMKSGA